MPKSDYDSPWKDAVECFLEQFLLFFFPQVHGEIDWTKGYELLDKELRKIVKDAELGKRFADVLVKVWKKNGEEFWLLLHIEIQGSFETDFNKRMYVYNYRIQDKYNHPVVSLVILCDKNPNWRPDKYMIDFGGCRLSFEYPVIKLMDYQSQWDRLERETNPFAIITMSHLKALETQENDTDRYRWKLELIKSLYQKGLDKQNILLLVQFIDWMLNLPKRLEMQLWQEIETLEQEKHMPYITSIEKIGIEKGIEKGMKKGRKETAKNLLKIKVLSKEEIAAVTNLPVEVVQKLKTELVNKEDKFTH